MKSYVVNLASAWLSVVTSILQKRKVCEFCRLMVEVQEELWRYKFLQNWKRI